MARQSVDNNPVLINRHTADANAKRFEEPSNQMITRIFDGDLITRFQQGPSYDIQRLLSAAHDNDIVRRSFHTPSDSDVTSNGLAQTPVACRFTVHALTDNLGA